VLAEAGGRVAEIRVHEGDVVQEGDVLVVLA
jgi:biotin carboxyl carrier protein